ncbi:MAG TPA: hypothetical protein VIM79_12015 [Niastella sp.]
MKSAPVKTQSPSLHSLIKSSVANRKERRTQQSSATVKTPTEETINELNNLGKEYPFCVNFKQKRHDPL